MWYTYNCLELGIKVLFRTGNKSISNGMQIYLLSMFKLEGGWVRLKAEGHWFKTMSLGNLTFYCVNHNEMSIEHAFYHGLSSFIRGSCPWSNGLLRLTLIFNPRIVQISGFPPTCCEEIPWLSLTFWGNFSLTFPDQTANICIQMKQSDVALSLPTNVMDLTINRYKVSANDMI